MFVSAVAATGCPSSTSAVVPVNPKPVPVVVKLDRAQVRAKLAERRQEMFQRFLAYREGRIYPINELPGGGFRHVWVDNYGNLCAAATLISGDWGRDASAAVGIENVEIKVADVKSGPIEDWILLSGLAKHELVAIQVPGWQGNDPVIVDPGPLEPSARDQEITRLYQIYVDVERQLTSLWDESLDEATDALMQHPALARQLLRDEVAGPGRFAAPPVG
jgi:hypothetical protein